MPYRNSIFLFDVDDTLTPSRQLINSEFKHFFKKFCKNYNVALVTGSDYPKTKEQLGEDIINSVRYSFNCSGNEIYKNGSIFYKSDFELPVSLENYLNSRLDYSKFPLRTGNHIERRTGTVNFSVVGRNASITERKLYSDWDIINRERYSIAKEINKIWLDVTAVIGGETGIDIFQKRCDKSQVLKWLPAYENVIFFGDKIEDQGNDFSLAEAIKWNNKGISKQVHCWEHTFELLVEIDKYANHKR